MHNMIMRSFASTTNKEENTAGNISTSLNNDGLMSGLPVPKSTSSFCDIVGGVNIVGKNRVGESQT